MASTIALSSCFAYVLMGYRVGGKNPSMAYGDQAQDILRKPVSPRFLRVLAEAACRRAAEAGLSSPSSKMLWIPSLGMWTRSRRHALLLLSLYRG